MNQIDTKVTTNDFQRRENRVRRRCEHVKLYITNQIDIQLQRFMTANFTGCIFGCLSCIRLILYLLIFICSI